jgi:exopolysaccharide biosynthesis protein
MEKKLFVVVLLISLLIGLSYSQKSFHPYPEIAHPGDSLAFVQIKTDSLFNSNQIISLLVLPRDFFDNYMFTLAYSKSDLYKTSLFAGSNNALAAVNGGFFDMDSGGSVTYLEVGDSVISYTKSSGEQDRRRNQLLNGAVVIFGDSLIIFEPAQPDQNYERSKSESAVLVTGPLLIRNSEKEELPDRKFVTDRHPRTCLCKTTAAVIIVAIDGRSEQADGMSLPEVQSFLQDLGCVDAINLDGGGSTTLWIKGKGIVNFPSDKTGERPVANAFLILKRQ